AGEFAAMAGVGAEARPQWRAAGRPATDPSRGVPGPHRFGGPATFRRAQSLDHGRSLAAAHHAVAATRPAAPATVPRRDTASCKQRPPHFHVTGEPPCNE